MMQVFEMVRESDESGVSGIGKVLEGMVFSDGTCVVRWVVQNKPVSTGVYASFKDFETLHISSHPTNGTKISWYDLEHAHTINYRR